MTNQQKQSKNEEWIPPMRVFLRNILADYRLTTGIPNLRMKMEYGPDRSNSFYPVYRPDGTPFLPSQYCKDQFTALRLFHNGISPTHKVTLRFGTDIEWIAGRSFYMLPAPLPNGAPAPSPGPDDLPDPYQLPVQCIPCIEPIMIA